MKKGVKCFICNKEIKKDKDFRIGRLGMSPFNANVFHKSCHKKFIIDGKNMEKTSSKYHFPLWKGIPFFGDCAKFNRSLIYSMGILSINSWGFWIMIATMAILMIPLLYLIAPIEFFYFAIIFIFIAIVYYVSRLIYFYKKYVW